MDSILNSSDDRDLDYNHEDDDDKGFYPETEIEEREESHTILHRIQEEESNTILQQIISNNMRDFVRIRPSGEIHLNMSEQLSVTLW